MRLKCIPFLMFIVFMFVQCKSSELSQIKRLVNHSASFKWLNPKQFESGRKLMFNKLNDDILQSDSIIIMESFPDGTGSYYTAIYGSKNKTVACYQEVMEIGKLTVDSLKYWSGHDDILSMVIRGELEEVKSQGEHSLITPSSRLIINILTRDDRGKFKRETIVTWEFSVLPNYNRKIEE